MPYTTIFQNPDSGERFTAKEFYKIQKKGYLKDIQQYKDIIAYIRNPLHSAQLTEDMELMFMGKNYGRELVRAEWEWYQFHEREQKAMIKMAKAEQKASIYAYNLDVEGLKKQVKKINELLMEHMESVQSLCEQPNEGRLIPSKEQEYLDVCDISLGCSQFWTRAVKSAECLSEVKNEL